MASENPCEYQYHMFVFRFWKHGFLKLEHGKKSGTTKSPMDFWSFQESVNQNRYFTTIVFTYLVLDEIISLTLIYDQDTTQSRRFILQYWGPSCNFIASCFIWLCFSLLHALYLWMYRFLFGFVAGLFLQKCTKYTCSLRNMAN